MAARPSCWSAKASRRRSRAAATASPAAFGPSSARPPHSSTLIRPWVGTDRGPDGLTSVTVTWEPGQAPPRNQRVDTVILKATTDDGRVLFQNPIGARASFDAAPGHIQLEMTIQGEDGKTLDSDYRGMEVPNLRVSRPTFATVQLMRTRS